LQESQLELWHATRLSAAGHLAEALAHELNKPLTAISNSVKAARRLLVSGMEERAAKVPDILDEVAEQALRGGHIIRRLREFVTRGETDKRAENVVAMIEEASALALTGPNALGVDVQFCPGSRSVNVLANRIQVQQVLLNLIHNALEAMTGCERRVIRLGTILLGDGFIEISVADTGSGLAADIAPRLFEPFVSAKEKGMGLGLSISRSIVEAHGGRIRAAPNPGGGTIFRFTLAGSTEGATGDR
jgi:two-component system sensor kinase FixL